MEFTREEKEKMCLEAFAEAKYNRYRESLSSIPSPFKSVSHIMFGPVETMDTIYGMRDSDLVKYVDMSISLDKGCKSIKTYKSRIYNFIDRRIRFSKAIENCYSEQTFETMYNLISNIFNTENLNIFELCNMLKDVERYSYKSKQERFVDLKNSLEIKIKDMQSL